ncbi:MAG: class I mannose-6-phosphate isomerase [Deltaproteobacteria bacterium]|nr:class I mannose-6-phosphate isomerase [Deltaproteobacteria bacterium]
MSAGPIVLAWDNWTPPARTPWGGRAIAELKARLPIEPARRAWPAVGESWELSVDPAFPSRVAATGALLSEVIAADPAAWLGAAAARRGETSTPLLVKLIDAAAPLSVQVHPRDDDPALASGESGKPECWVVLAAAPEAGIWLGFEPGVTRADVVMALDRGASLTPLLHFVRVRPGDAFTIPPGTVHAIGAGVTLLEAQLVRPGRTGVTYRFWDWERGRTLHRERALAVAEVAPYEAHAPTPELLARDGALVHERVLAFAHMTLERASGAGRLVLPDVDALRAVVATSDLELAGVRLLRGQTAAVPAACRAVELVLPPGGEAWIVHA